MDWKTPLAYISASVDQDRSHYHQERPHQGKGNVVLMPTADHRQQRAGPIHCHERLGGLLKYYDRNAA